MPFGQADRADVEARALGEVISSVEPPPTSSTSVSSSSRAAVGDAAARELRLLLAAQQAGREAVAPLDLAEEGLAVLGVADRAGADRQHALGAESSSSRR